MAYCPYCLGNPIGITERCPMSCYPRWDGPCVYPGFSYTITNIEEPDMPESRYPLPLSSYTTQELERLTTLTERELKPGEYGRLDGVKIGTALRLQSHLVAFHDGTYRWVDQTLRYRRVVSFTDPTHLDPPQAEMLAELERRRRPPISNATHAGRTVYDRGSRQPRIVLNTRGCHLVVAGRKYLGDPSTSDVFTLNPVTGGVHGGKASDYTESL